MKLVPDKISARTHGEVVESRRRKTIVAIANKRRHSNLTEKYSSNEQCE